MAVHPIPDEPWTVVEPLLPPHRATRARPPFPIPDQARCSGVVFVLKQDAARGRFAASLARRSLSFRSLPTGLEKPARHEEPR